MPQVAGIAGRPALPHPFQAACSECRRPRLSLRRFYDRLAERGYVIYPGKLTVADSFRVGCIGRLGEAEMQGCSTLFRDILKDMGVSRCGPA